MHTITHDRRGQRVAIQFPDLPPDVLASYPFPEPVAEVIADAERAWSSWADIEAGWLAAERARTTSGPEVDKALLIEAIRGGEPDPGTPNTDRADRAEVVAWTRLELARESTRAALNAARDAVSAHLAAHLADVAAYEVAQVEAADKANAEVQQAQARAGAAAAAVGRTFYAMHVYAGRSIQRDPQDYAMQPQDGTDPDRIRRYNDRIRREWAERATQVEAASPTVRETHGAGTRENPKGIVNGTLIDA